MKVLFGALMLAFLATGAASFNNEEAKPKVEEPVLVEYIDFQPMIIIAEPKKTLTNFNF